MSNTESTKQTAEITTHPSRRSARVDATMRRLPPKLDGAEIYGEIAKSLSKVEQNLHLGGFDGRPDLVMEAFKELNELNRAACDTFMELHRQVLGRALDTRVQAFWDELWKRDAKK